MANWDSELLGKVAIPIITFIGGFLVSRLTFSKKERFDVEQQRVNTAASLVAEQDRTFQEFCTALNKFTAKEAEPTLDDFFDIATKGEGYFNRLKITSDAILADKVDRLSVENTLLPMIKEAIDKSLPAFYGTLKFIAEKKNIPYSGDLKRENYLSLYKVYERQT